MLRAVLILLFVFLSMMAAGVLGASAGLVFGDPVLGGTIGVVSGFALGLFVALRGTRAAGRRLGATLALAYLVVVLASIVYGFATGPLAGLYAVVLTAPWSQLAVFFIDTFAPGLLNRVYVSVMVLVASALINAMFFFFLGVLPSYLGVRRT